MMKHKIAISLVSGALLGALTGCQLAIPGLSSPTPAPAFQDSLIGLFITVPTSPMDPGLSGRIDATRSKTTLAGATQPTDTYRFPEVIGFYMMETTKGTEDGQGWVDSLFASDSFTDLYGDRATTNDNILDRTLGGTLHVTAGYHEFCVYSIRQTPDVDVYIDGSNGQCESMDADPSITPSKAHLQSESNTTTTNGKSVTTSMSVTFTVKFEPNPVTIVIADMDANNVQLSRTQYSPGDVPSSLTPEPGTAYVIVETHTVDENQQIGVVRNLYSPEDPKLYTFAARSDGICIQYITDILWP